jgi:hypothetical protein
MNSNYSFAFGRRQPVTRPVPVPRQVPQPVPQPVPRQVPQPVQSNRFSINRLIHVKSSGGCRSCG